jgi:hypothetical protein
LFLHRHHALERQGVIDDIAVGMADDGRRGGRMFDNMVPAKPLYSWRPFCGWRTVPLNQTLLNASATDQAQQYHDYGDHQ